MSAPNLVEAIASYMRRYVVFQAEAQVLALVLWIIHTHAFRVAEATPYPLIMSPEKRSGKSRLLEVLEPIVARGWFISGSSEAVLFRKIAHHEPTLLLDEVDALFGTYVEKTEPIRAVLNAGSRRGGVVSRCVGPNHDVMDFEVFGPKCLAGIDNGRLPDTIRDRAIPIGLHRKLDEPIERFRRGRARREAEEIVPLIESWVDAHAEALAEAEPDLPEELDDRAAEGWEPLLAIADALGHDLPDRARKAAVALSGTHDIEEASFGSQLLADLQGLWSGDDLGWTVKSEDLCRQLNGLEDRPWRAWGKHRPVPNLTQRDLALQLRPYGIRPKTVRLGQGETAKGYQRGQFEDAWRRYAPQTNDDQEVE